MTTAIDPKFARTVCACTQCVSKCKEYPGTCGSGDVARILGELGEPPERAAAYFERGRCTIVGNRAKGEIYVLPSITPKQQPDGRCIFLTPDDRCRVHAVSPVGCAFFDPHQSRAEGDARLFSVLERERTDPGYTATWLQLDNAARLTARDRGHVATLGKTLKQAKNRGLDTGGE